MCACDYPDYVNFLLVIVPLGIIAGELKWSATTVFVLNFLAIIPLAAVLSFATEEIAMKLGETMGGLLNATFGNAVELIVSAASTLPHPSLTLIPHGSPSRFRRTAGSHAFVPRF